MGAFINKKGGIVLRKRFLIGKASAQARLEAIKYDR